MPGMRLRRSILIRLGTTALPFCLMGSFVACLALCSEYRNDADRECRKPNAHSITESHHAEHCPIAEPFLTLPGRQSDVSCPKKIAKAHSAFAVPPPSTNPQASQYVVLDLSMHIFDLPLKRLAFLRI
jgi:hypothetical protein